MLIPTSANQRLRSSALRFYFIVGFLRQQYCLWLGFLEKKKKKTSEKKGCVIKIYWESQGEICEGLWKTGLDRERCWSTCNWGLNKPSWTPGAQLSQFEAKGRHFCPHLRHGIASCRWPFPVQDITVSNRELISQNFTSLLKKVHEQKYGIFIIGGFK